jgi:hypothetical protein
MGGELMGWQCWRRRLLEETLQKVMGFANIVSIFRRSPHSSMGAVPRASLSSVKQLWLGSSGACNACNH